MLKNSDKIEGTTVPAIEMVLALSAEEEDIGK